MSDAPPFIPPPAPVVPMPVSPAASPRGSAIVSVYSLTLLLVALIISYLVKNETLMTALIAVIATNATTCVSFYVGSSASSQSKDVVISGQLPQPPAALALMHRAGQP